MTGTTVLILGGEDEHALHVLDALRRRGADAELLDSRWFPSQMMLSFDPVRGEGQVRLPGGRTLGFGQVSSVYWRRYEGIGCVELPDPEQSFIAANDPRSLFESLLLRLPARWVNGWNAYLLHQTKPAQLAIVSASGIEIPETFWRMTASPCGRSPPGIPPAFSSRCRGAHTRAD